ncbi:MAG: hypothetical protein HXS52_04740 [Theionarchaea archaeon]|nr:hypothetical protein [Theionarchaea archaeon]MBU7037213.1 hypothetical protein [Theionarchaea archaeon]
MERGCSCKRDPAVIMVKMGTQMVGLIGLTDLFDEWMSKDRMPDTLEEKEILEGVRKRNYVSPPSENIYVEALRSEYASYVRHKKHSGRQSPRP